MFGGEIIKLIGYTGTFVYLYDYFTFYYSSEFIISF